MKDLLNVYRAALRQCGGCFTRDAAPVNNADAVRGRSTLAEVQHLLWMLDQMDTMLDQMDDMPLCKEWGSLMTKFHRWLGFVQGWMWHQQVFSIDEMREQTRAALT